MVAPPHFRQTSADARASPNPAISGATSPTPHDLPFRAPGSPHASSDRPRPSTPDGPSHLATSAATRCSTSRDGSGRHSLRRSDAAAEATSFNFREADFTLLSSVEECIGDLALIEKRHITKASRAKQLAQVLTCRRSRPLRLRHPSLSCNSWVHIPHLTINCHLVIA